MTEIIEGFLGFETFDFGVFLGRKTWQVFSVWLDLSRDLSRAFWGYSHSW